MEKKTCNFVGKILTNFKKPGWRAKTEIVVYTPEGIYTASVIIREIEFTINDMSYTIDVPKVWKFTQLRAGSRKSVALPLKLRFNDGLEIEGQTLDLSVGGFSFISDKVLSTVHTRFACNCKMVFPNDLIMNFPDGVLETDAMYVRQKNIDDDYELRDSKILCFKFKDLSSDKAMIIKNFLMKLD